jgi:hypothetical protein
MSQPERETTSSFRDVQFTDGKGYERHGSPTFYALLDRMAEVHSRKSHDYASNSNPYGNYEFAGLVASMFAHSPLDAGFAGRMAEKIYRLSILEGGDKTPKNESVDDTDEDIAVIAALWMSARKDRRSKPNPLETELFDLIKLMPDKQTDKIIDFILEMRKIRHMRDMQGTDHPRQGVSEEAVCSIINAETYLTSADRIRAISYLTECQRRYEESTAKART